MTSLHGKVALITGGARGVGAATAAGLVEAGAKVVLVDLDAEPLREVVQRLGPEHAASITGDVTQLADMEAAVALAVERFGHIDIVMANAGIASFGSVAAVDPADFRRVIDINVIGAFHTVRAALPQIIASKGYILVVSSAAAFATAPGLSAYNASKAGAEHLADSLRLELGFRGVAVGSAHMLWIDTPMVQEAKSDLTAFNQMLKALPGFLGATTSVEACAEGFVRGIARRSRRIYVPRAVGLLRWLKPVLTSGLSERVSRRDTGRIVELMDSEVAALGRSTSSRVAAAAQPVESA